MPSSPLLDLGVQALAFFPPIQGSSPAFYPQTLVSKPQLQNLSFAEAGGRVLEQELSGTVFIPGDVTQEGDLQVSVFCPTPHLQSFSPATMPWSPQSLCPALPPVFRNEQRLKPLPPVTSF